MQFRALSMDAVQNLILGHPGAPMGMAEIAVALWAGHYRHNPTNPKWVNRDRFVLSNGHGLMLHYSLLHLTGYDLPMSEISNFRQLHSKQRATLKCISQCRNRPDHWDKGITNAVGMALAEKLLCGRVQCGWRKHR